MNAPKVDVLAVMDRLCMLATDKAEGRISGVEARFARAAVAELIEAAKSVYALYPKHWDLTDGGAVIFPENVPLFESAFENLRASLVRIGGDA